MAVTCSAGRGSGAAYKPTPMAAGGYGRPSITPAASNVRPTIVPPKSATAAGRGKSFVSKQQCTLLISEA